MFPSGRMFFAECVAVVEDSDGNMDTAVVLLVREVAANDFPTTSGASTSAGKEESQKAAKVHALVCVDYASLPAAGVAHTAVTSGARLFCVGNPSSINLESTSESSNEFEPPTWHTSVGTCQGYMAARNGGRLQHSCWTYWGHSGAPLFNQDGEVTGLHSSWDQDSGMREGQKLRHLHAAIRAALLKTSAP